MPLPEFGHKIVTQAQRAEVAERFVNPCVLGPRRRARLVGAKRSTDSHSDPTVLPLRYMNHAHKSFRRSAWDFQKS